MKCHFCSTPAELWRQASLSRCPKCHVEVPHCGCKFSKEALTCKSKHELDLEAAKLFTVDFGVTKKVSTSCESLQTKKPIRLGESSVYFNKSQATTKEEAAAIAGIYYTSLVQFWIKQYGKTVDGFPASQDTLCISLLECEKEFAVVLSYNHYDITHVPTVLRGHPDFTNLIIEADPHIQYDKSSLKHWMFDKTTPKLCPYFQKLEFRAESGGWRQYNGVYPLTAINYHHAEVRACVFAVKRGWGIVSIMPTRVCCPDCNGFLAGINELEKVPKHLRGK